MVERKYLDIKICKARITWASTKKKTKEKLNDYEFELFVFHSLIFNQEMNGASEILAELDK